MRNPFRNPFGPFKQARGWAAPKVAGNNVNARHVELFKGNNMFMHTSVFKLPKLQPIQFNMADLDAEFDKLNGLCNQANNNGMFIDPNKIRGLKADMLWMDDPIANRAFGYKQVRVPKSKVPAIRELDDWSREFHIALEICDAVLNESYRLRVDMRHMGGDDLEYSFGDGNRRAIADFFKQQVKDAGMIVYGGGNFSVAFGKRGSSRIYKWSVRSGDAGVHWNKLCRLKHYNNVHLPKVYELHEFRNGMILTQTERLLSAGVYSDQCAGRGKPIDVWAADALSDMMCDAWNSAAFESVQKQFGTSAALCIQRIGLWKEKNQLTGDLHSENYMFREDGTIVFTDPVSYIRGGEPDVTNF